VITFPTTAPTGWAVTAFNGTTTSVTGANVIGQTASSITTATLVGVTVNGDVIRYTAVPF
jgi:hypothetical protein